MTRYTLIILLIALFATDAMAMEKAQDFTLSNGLKVIFMPVSDNQVASLSLVIPGTSLRQSTESAGTEELLMTVMTKGSDKYPGDKVHKALDQYGSTIYKSIGKDYSEFGMSTIVPFFNQTLDIFADAFLNPELSDKVIELEKQKHLAYLRARQNDPDQYLSIVLNDLYYRNHPYHNDIDGTEETVSALSKEKLAKHHAIITNCGSSFIVVVANLGREQLRTKLEGYFGKLSRTSFIGLGLPAFEKGETAFTTAERQLPTHYILGKFDAPAIDKQDYASLKMGLKVLSQRLWEEVRTKRALTYAVSSSISSSATNYGYIYLNTTNMPEAMSVIFNEINKIKTEPIKTEELQATKAVYKTQYFMSIEPNSSQAAYLAHAEVYFGDYQKRQLLIDAIENTTPESVKAALIKYVENFTFAVVGTADKIDEKLFKYENSVITKTTSTGE